MENHKEYDIEKLRCYYFDEKLPIAEIAKIYSTYPTKIYRILKKSFPNIKYRKVKKGKLRQALTKEKLIELHYEKRLPLSEIAKMYGSTYRSVHIYMKHLNLPTKRTRIKEYSSGHKIKKIDLSKEKLYELYYKQKLSLQKIGKLYGKPREYIHRWMRIYGFKTRTRSDAWKHRGTEDVYKINENFFHNWSKEMSYVLGLILADGNIDAETNQVKIKIKEGYLLENVKKTLNSEHPIKYDKITDMYSFGFCRKKMSNKLFELGVTSRKSLNVRFPDVPDEFLSHFIRGVFDGDGSVFFEPRSKTYPLRVSFISGSKEFITTLENTLHSHAGLRKRNIYKLHRKNISYYIRYSHKESLKFFDYIYAGADESLRLERKYQKFMGMGSVQSKNLSSWEERFEALKEYKKNHGDCNVPRSWPENLQLANWVNKQRANYRSEIISIDRIRRLECIDFIWHPSKRS
jgi:predicted DNA-binding protein YlxM (UPF0122 family)